MMEGDESQKRINKRSSSGGQPDDASMEYRIPLELENNYQSHPLKAIKTV
jgi:hypothetical protein